MLGDARYANRLAEKAIPLQKRCDIEECTARQSSFLAKFIESTGDRAALNCAALLTCVAQLIVS